MKNINKFKIKQIQTVIIEKNKIVGIVGENLK